MRSYLLLMALCVLGLANSQGLAGAVLRLGLGNTQPPLGLQPDPNTPNFPPGSIIDPFTSIGLNDWTFGPALPSNLILTPGQSIIVQIQMIDTPSYTFPEVTGSRLQNWSVRLNFNPSVMSASRDPDTFDNQSFQMTVNDGFGFSQSNTTGPNLSSTSTSVGIGNVQVFYSGFGSGAHNYALANVVVTANGVGNGILSLTDLHPAQPEWVNYAGASFDSSIFASAPSISINVVPEPSALALGACGIVAQMIRRRYARKGNIEC